MDRESLENISILSQLEKTLQMFRKYYQYEKIEGAERKCIDKIPEKAFREAIANALIHRMWDIPASIKVSMYADRIEISSPGGLPAGISEEEYLNGQISILRNPIIGNVFFRLKYIEKFGTGIKQLEPVDDGQHIIMDYSIHDAIEAGFNHVVFIIRKDIEGEFRSVMGDRIASICGKSGVTVDYAFQDIEDIPGELPAGRTKPWGTGQAVLAAKAVLKTPFVVINADDYYGKEGFRLVHEYLVNGGQSCMAGFVLKNTLSDNGGVTRGICKMDDQNNLTEVVETKNIVKTADGAAADGIAIDTESLVSMNMWGLTPEFLDMLETGFAEFFETEVPTDPLKAEFLIPTFIGELLDEKKMTIKVLRTNDIWYGMTYKEDVEAVKESFKGMIEDGVYEKDLFGDL